MWGLEVGGHTMHELLRRERTNKRRRLFGRGLRRRRLFYLALVLATLGAERRLKNISIFLGSFESLPSEIQEFLLLRSLDTACLLRPLHNPPAAWFPAISVG